jgi:diguanylate cyclase (GGDEF)-like protein
MDVKDHTWKNQTNLKLTDYLQTEANGRENLGEEIPVAVYRLMEYSFREELTEQLGREEQIRVFRNAGYRAGKYFAGKNLDLSLPFPEFAAQLQKRLEDFKIGVLRIEKMEEDTGKIILTVSEDADCSGLPTLGETVCNYDEGFLSGILTAYSGKPYTAIEIDCWATGDRVCRFRAEVKDSFGDRELSEPYQSIKRDFQSLQREVDELIAYSAELSRGNLSVDFPSKDNYLCENLKNLHVNLNHLTWQAQQVARGDYSQQVAYLGDFSAAFNEMTKQLKEREAQLRGEMIRAKNHAEAIEGYNELMVAMLSKRKEWLLVVDRDTKEILYCNKKERKADEQICAVCKKRLPFHQELLRWNSDEQYKVWELASEADTYYRITSFPIEWKEHASYVHIIVDITDEKQTAHTLASKAYHDAGTGIRNRLFFEEYMEKILREGQDTTLCYLDLDGLKYVNDTYGHLEGDSYIQNFVELIKANFRSEDTFARIGGDEFCLVFSGSIKELIERKMAEILKEFQQAGFAEYQCSFSYGIVGIDGGTNTLSYDEILQKADGIMYECKRRNKEKYPQLVR